MRETISEQLEDADVECPDCGSDETYTVNGGETYKCRLCLSVFESED